VEQTSITAVFDHPSAARDAEAALAGADLGISAVHVLPGESEEVVRRQRMTSPNEIPRAVVPPDVGGAVGFTLGFLGGGFFGLLLGSGALNIMGREPAMAAGPFLSALIGAVVLGLAGAFAGYVFNAPLPALDPAPEHGDARRKLTIVSADVPAERQGEVLELLERFGPSSVGAWRRVDGSWLPA